MICPSTICYANNKQALFNLKFGIIQIFGDSAPVATFTNENLLMDFITSEKEKYNHAEIIILNIDESNNHRDIIQQITNITPKTVILITGKTNILLRIQNENKHDSRFHYLPEPFNQESFELAVRQLQASQINIIKLLSLENNDTRIEEKVNESLQKLIDANMAKDQFLSIIAHDLKSPFQVLLGVSEMLLEDWGTLDENSKLEMIGDIRKTSNETFKLLCNLLEWTRGQKEKLQRTIKEVNVRELVESAVKISQNHANVKGIYVENEISVDLKVNTDEQMIATVFRNLISNAVQYVQPGGKINISALEEGECTTFCIADNGQGIEKAHILEFFSKESYKKMKGNASAFKGLGLLICKDFVEKNGGKIWLETQKGEGSKFFFTLPN
jgi:K+-sensing histidine kinase KdpD